MVDLGRATEIRLRKTGAERALRHRHTRRPIATGQRRVLFCGACTGCELHWNRAPIVLQDERQSWGTRAFMQR